MRLAIQKTVTEQMRVLSYKVTMSDAKLSCHTRKGFGGIDVTESHKHF